MTYNREIFRYQYVIVQDFVRHLAYYRQIRKHSIKPSSFWASTSNAHLEAAVSDWCKAFGSPKSNSTHWHHIPIEGKEKTLEQFRQVIYKVISQSDWEKYHEEMLDFRNKYVSHLETDNIPIVPLLDNSLKVAFAYDDWIRDITSEDSLDVISMKQLYEKCLKEAEDVILNGKRQ
jgi:hypothetical protein